MLLQFDVLIVDNIIGIGVMFGMAFIMTMLTDEDMSLSTFIIWLMVFSGFVCWGGLLPLWVLILTLVMGSGILYLEHRRN